MHKTYLEVEWDAELDGETLTLEEAGLPAVVGVPTLYVECENCEEAVTDYLTDKFGWLVKSWKPAEKYNL